MCAGCCHRQAALGVFSPSSWWGVGRPRLLTGTGLDAPRRVALRSLLSLVWLTCVDCLEGVFGGGCVAVQASVGMLQPTLGHTRTAVLLC